MRLTTLRAEAVDVDAPAGVAYFLDGDYLGQTIRHCRNHPEHDAPEPLRDRIFAWRAALSDGEWVRHDPSPWIGGQHAAGPAR